MFIYLLCLFIYSFIYFIPNLFFHVLLSILRNLYHRPDENRMFRKILRSKTNFATDFSVFDRFDVILCVCGGGGGVGVCVCVCGDKDSGDQDLHTGTKSSLELILENL